MYVCYLQDQLKDYLDKKERGELTVQKKTNFIKTILKKVSHAKHTFQPAKQLYFH